MNGYDIVGEFIEQHWDEAFPEDIRDMGIAVFKQKYSWEDDTKWELCIEYFRLAYPNCIEWDMDWNEGQTDIKDIYIISIENMILKRNTWRYGFIG